MFDLYMDDWRTPPAGWKLARTVWDTKLLLKGGLVNRLSLDHDMGMCDACRGRLDLPVVGWCPHVEDGTALVRWMITTNTWPTCRPTVHSGNHVGRERMEGMIARYWKIG